MNILKILKSCRGAVNKAALLGTSVVVGVAGLNIYHYATERPAKQQERIYNLASMMRYGSLPAEYAKIELELGNTAFATPQEIAKMQGQNSFDGGVGAIDALEQAFANGKVFLNGDNSLGLGNDAQLLRQGGSADGSDGSAAASARAAAAALEQSGQEGSKAGAQGANGAAGKNGFASSQMATAGGHNLQAGSGGLSPSGKSNTAAAVKSASASVAAVGTALTTTNSKLLATNRSSKYDGGSRKSSLGKSESAELKGLRGIAVHSGKVAASATRAANEGASPFLNKSEIAGGLHVAGDFSLSNELDGIGDDSFLEPNTDAKLKNLDDKMDEIDTTEQEKEQKLYSLGMALLGLVTATVGAMVAISALAEKAKGGVYALWAAVAAIAAVMLGLLAWYIADVVQASQKYGWNGWTGTFVGIAVLCIVGVGAAVISGAMGGKFSAWITQAAGKLGVGGAGSGIGAVASAGGEKVISSAVSQGKES